MNNQKILVMEYMQFCLKQLQRELSQTEIDRMRVIREQLALAHDEIVRRGKKILLSAVG